MGHYPQIGHSSRPSYRSSQIRLFFCHQTFTSYCIPGPFRPAAKFRAGEPYVRPAKSQLPVASFLQKTAAAAPPADALTGATIWLRSSKNATHRSSGRCLTRATIWLRSSKNAIPPVLRPMPHESNNLASFLENATRRPLRPMPSREQTIWLRSSKNAPAALRPMPYESKQSGFVSQKSNPPLIRPVPTS